MIATVMLELRESFVQVGIKLFMQWFVEGFKVQGGAVVG
jgi:hypothetical protein